MTLTTDKNHPGLNKQKENGQNEAYLVLSEEEREKGFVRPYRDTYIHKGIPPKYPLRDLTDEEKERFESFGYIKYEEYPESERPNKRRYWTKQMLNSGCGSETKIGEAISATYARQPSFYGSTFCCHCGKHFPVSEFVWEDGTVVGS